MRKTSLVTGGCGFVGRHITKRLLAHGSSVWIIDNLSAGQNPAAWLPRDFVYERQEHGWTFFRNAEQSVVFIQDDALSFFTAQLQLGSARPQAPLPAFADVFHLASVVGGRATIEGDPMAVAIDLAIDAIFFRWAVHNRTRISRILCASSSAAYPVDVQAAETAVALHEDMITFSGTLGMPDMTYGWSKLTAEYLARIAARVYGLRVTCVRPFSGYGGDQDLSYPIPAIARRAVRHEDPLTVWGTGTQGRDFVHIDDCVEGMFRALEVITDGSAVNIGTGRLTSFLEVAVMCAGLARYRPTIQPLVNRPTGVQSRRSDTAYMQRVLQWQPAISLEVGLGWVMEEQRTMVGAAPVAQPSSRVTG